jgi:apolipoprotein N-acyltransferase
MLSLPTRYPRLAVLIAGIASATGFAPLGLWPVTLLALALLLHVLGQAGTLRRTFLLGWLFGVGHFVLGNNWIATAFTYQAAMPGWLGWVAVGLLALYLAVYPGLAAASAWWLARAVARNTPTPAQAEPVEASRAVFTLTLLFAGTWIISEWLRSWVFTGFAWNPLSVVGAEHAVLAKLIGSYGLSGLVCLFAGALVMLANRLGAGHGVVLVRCTQR